MNNVDLVISWMYVFIDDLENDPSDTVCYDKEGLMNELKQQIELLKNSQ